MGNEQQIFHFNDRKQGFSRALMRNFEIITVLLVSHHQIYEIEYRKVSEYHQVTDLYISNSISSDIYAIQPLSQFFYIQNTKNKNENVPRKN